MDKFIPGTLIFYISFAINFAEAKFWYLALSGAAYKGAMTVTKEALPSTCAGKDLDLLDDRQRMLCEVIQQGLNEAMVECQNQFQDRRWNCSDDNKNDMFQRFLLRTSGREKAFVYAIGNAGVMHAVTRACTTSRLATCECDNRFKSGSPKEMFNWGGCSANVRYGYRFTQNYLDPAENRENSTGLMNLWNNKAGRKMAKKTRLKCKCHGVSGSCTTKICWRVLLPLNKIAANLKRKFEGASKVRLNTRKMRLRPHGKKQKKPGKNDLVYLSDSSDFCDYDPAIGSHGTRGRRCNRTSRGMDGCSLMCCGRGYATIIEDVVEDCRCKFLWCCEVICEKCSRKVEKTYCN